ncbi:hypothetical protein N0B30_23810 [Bacillus subtilis]|uniref:hypothetical protein n=1 Tax=Bacillus subtilis group TaxID=653685 RepID=UPI00080C6F8F|nr:MULTISPECIES: hypothetical protein [Bacillus subtilis group]MCT6515651.1 hypothetical protein [Bacillus subtilis]OCB98120.1 hypothetical protein SRCM101294_00774 [Bacillus amyloliquefaciens]QEO08525.1 hypothetical protein FLQ07_23410 [Bacillus paralicheniformis]HEO2443883.1 hypothetical protein [Streptococcus agalactiae]
MADIKQYFLKDNDDFKPPFLAEEAYIIIQEQSSQCTLELALALLPTLGKITSITHFRNAHKLQFSTYIESNQYKLFIDGGLASNYGGEGGRAFKAFLQAVGIPEEEIAFVTRYNGEEIAVIEIGLQDETTPLHKFDDFLAETSNPLKKQSEDEQFIRKMIDSIYYNIGSILKTSKQLEKHIRKKTADEEISKGMYSRIREELSPLIKWR